ncbi:uncharacterized protein LOC135491356 [Lineus longissimus]|uniref:uncharacterized protein LOC135491356 n=1 Tax=Lineus longissimus TaxID=88925 RepID=UPI002B4CF3E2
MGEGCCERFKICMGRIPCASLIGFIFFILGVTIYIGAILSAFDIVTKYFEFDYDLKRIVVPFYIVMLALGIFFIVFAFLTTGETGKELCHKECCNVTGRIIEVICIFIAWVLNVGFLIVSGVTLIPLVIFLVMKMSCETEFVKSLTECVRLIPIGPMSSQNNTICGDKASEFCKQADEIKSNMIVAYFGSIIVCIGLIQFLMAMSANYVHVKDDEDGAGYEDLDKPKTPAPAP